MDDKGIMLNSIKTRILNTMEKFIGAVVDDRTKDRMRDSIMNELMDFDNIYPGFGLDTDKTSFLIITEDGMNFQLVANNSYTRTLFDGLGKLAIEQQRRLQGIVFTPGEGPTNEFHQAVLKVVEELIAIDPVPDSPEGRLLETLSTAVSEYEKIRYPIDPPTEAEAFRKEQESDDGKGDGRLIGVSEIAQSASVTAAAVSNWQTRHSDFPEPVVRLKSGPVFNSNQIQEWLEEKGKLLCRKGET